MPASSHPNTFGMIGFCDVQLLFCWGRGRGFRCPIGMRCFCCGNTIFPSYQSIVCAHTCTNHHYHCCFLCCIMFCTGTGCLCSFDSAHHFTGAEQSTELTYSLYHIHTHKHTHTETLPTRSQNYGLLKKEIKTFHG